MPSLTRSFTDRPRLMYDTLEITMMSGFGVAGAEVPESVAVLAVLPTRVVHRHLATAQGRP